MALLRSISSRRWAIQDLLDPRLGEVGGHADLQGYYVTPVVAAVPLILWVPWLARQTPASDSHRLLLHLPQQAKS